MTLRRVEQMIGLRWKRSQRPVVRMLYSVDDVSVHRDDVMRVAFAGSIEMCQPKNLFIIGLIALFSVPCFSTYGQQRSRVGSPTIGGSPIGGARAGGGDARGLSGARSGAGLRNNPVANPAPSLTPHEVLNPRGSRSTGQTLNPEPSINRPRGGDGPLPAARQPSPMTGEYDSPLQSVGSDATANPDSDAGRPLAATTNSPPRVTSAAEKILEAVVDLDRKLEKVSPDSGWSKRLSLEELRFVPVFSEQPADDNQRKTLEKILKTYQTVATDDQSAAINSLPEFKQTLDSIQEYLSPIDVRRRKQAPTSFVQLKSSLEWYKNGAAWVDYLVPPELTATNGETSLSKEQAEKRLKRFNKVAGDSAYKKVTSLKGFKPAYNSIKAIVAGQSP